MLQVFCVLGEDLGFLLLALDYLLPGNFLFKVRFSKVSVVEVVRVGL